jgi:hypothetical protein
LQAEILLRDPGGVEGVRLNDVSARSQVFAMNLFDYLGLGQAKNVVIVLEILGMVSEAVAAIIFLLEAKPLDHGTHRSVKDQDALCQRLYDIE